MTLGRMAREELGGDPLDGVPRATTHILFDFFGTLVAYSASLTEQSHQGSFEIVREAGFTGGYQRFLEEWPALFRQFERRARRSYREYSMTEVGAAFLRQAVACEDEALAHRFAMAYLAEWNRGVVYDPEVATWLRRLRQSYGLGIITNTHDPDLVPDHLDRMGVGGLFEPVVTSIGCGVRKPSSEIFELALQAAGVTAKQCVFVGDSYEADYLGARAVGMEAYLLDPEGAAAVPPAHRLDSLTALEERLG